MVSLGERESEGPEIEGDAFDLVSSSIAHSFFFCLESEKDQCAGEAIRRRAKKDEDT
jgi:hypothetical protein